MSLFNNSNQLVYYLESFQKRNDHDEQEGKIARNFYRTHADIPVEHVEFKATDSDAGRLATSGKASANSAGKPRPITAPVTCEIGENFQQSHSVNSIKPSNDFLSLFSIKIPEPNETIFSKILPYEKLALYECYRVRRPKRNSKCTSTCSLTHSVSKEILENYKQENWKYLKQFMKYSTSKLI